MNKNRWSEKDFFRFVLRSAAVYNIVWGLWVIAFPNALFDFADLARPNYPQIWQCVGMIVGVYGVGYWIASYDPIRHWPIVLVGFLGKVFGPIGFIYGLPGGVFNWKFGLTNLTNDVIWWIPFFLILKSALSEILNPPVAAPKSVEQLKAGGPLSVLFSDRWLVLCVRHAGCTFCREELSNFHRFEKKFLSLGLKTAVVHMGSGESGEEMRRKYELTSTLFLSDPEQHMYRLFNFKRGSWSELLGLRNWIPGFKGAVLKRHGVGGLEGDGKQLGGVVYFDRGDFKVLHQAVYAGDVGDFDELLTRLSEQLAPTKF